MLQTQVAYWTLQEAKRHNLTAEELEARNLTIQEFNAKENQRHNQMNEVINISEINEKRRHNIAQENLGFDSLAETKRHNVVTEQQTAQSIIVDRFNAETNRRNAFTNYLNAQTNRYAATQQAGIGWQNASTNRMNAKTSARSVANTENVLNETIRHNIQEEKLGVAHEANTTLSTIVGGFTNIQRNSVESQKAATQAASEARKAEQSYWNSQW